MTKYPFIVDLMTFKSYTLPYLGKGISMNTVFFIFSTLMILCFSSLTFAASSNAIIGDWALADQYCSSGVPTNGGPFVIGRDQATLTFTQNGIFTSQTTIQGYTDTVSYPYTADDKLITITAAPNAKVTSSYFITAKQELVILATGFGDGGNCPKGEALITKFNRN